jgi:hypothetical protein
MSLSFDLEEIGLIALIALILLSRWIFPPTRFGAWVARRFVPHGRPRHGWREWSWPERIAVGLAMAFLAALWIHRTASLASAVAAFGLFMLIIGIRGLLIARHQVSLSHASSPPAVTGPESKPLPTAGDRHSATGSASRATGG